MSNDLNIKKPRFNAISSSQNSKCLSLKQLVDQPYAPIFNNQSGHHLKSKELDELKRLTVLENGAKVSALISMNDWLESFIGESLYSTPFYKQYNKNIGSFEQYPTINRADLSENITEFVPDTLPIDRVIAFETSGTTGHALIIPSHPLVAAKYSIYHKKALAWNNVDVQTFKSDVAIVLAGYQEKCFTYASLSPYLKNKGLLKLNFHPYDWAKPSDRQNFIDANKPDLMSGDPISLSELSNIPFKHCPHGILSTSMTMLKATREKFETRFNCPVIDLYSLNEVGPIGCSVPGKDGFRLLQSKLLVEILDAEGKPVENGKRGEVVVTGGFNDYLPLIRYRTGDFARLVLDGEHWFIKDLEGRPPVQFETIDGQWLNNVDVTHLLQKFPLSQFALHQQSNGDMVIDLPAKSNSKQIKEKLALTFGQQVTTRLLKSQSSDKKIIQYTSDLRKIF